MPLTDATDLLISTLTDALTGKTVALGFSDISRFSSAIHSLKGDPHARACVFSGVVRASIAADPGIRAAFIQLAKELRP